MQRVTMDDIKASHGVPIESVLPYTECTEGIEEMEFDSNVSRFRFDNKALQLFLGLTGTDKEYEVSQLGFMKAMRTAGFPESVIKSYPTDLMIGPLNWGFPQKAKNVKAFVQKDKLVGFVKPSVDLVSTKELLQVVHEASQGKVLFERFDHDIFFTNCSFIWPELQHHWADDRLPEKGDVLLCGGNFQNSVMGEHPLEVSMYTYRLSCSNGMISKNNVFKWSRKTETVPILDWFRDKIVTASQLAEAEFEHVERMINTPVRADHFVDLITNIFAEYGISERQRVLILEQFKLNPARNMWDVINAITSIANDDSLKDNAQAVRRLQLIGGDIIARTTVCQTCFSVRRN